MATLIKLHRFRDTKISTSGILTIDGNFFCFTLEDPHQDRKIAGNTRIPSGFYEVKLREEITPLTEKYQKKYPYFTRHIQICDVPQFRHVYFHIGNKAEHSQGCVLLGKSITTDFVGNSAKTFERFYKKIQRLLLAEEKVYVAITDQISS